MAKPNEVAVDEAMLMLETDYNAHIVIPVSKAALLNDIQVWFRKYDSATNAHVISPATGDSAHPQVRLIPAEHVIAAKMLAAMAAKETT